VNLLLPPLVAAVALSVYVATLSKDRTDGDDRRMAADSMVRHHEAAIRLGVSLFADADPDDNLTPDDSVSVAPFFDVLDWNSALARDTQNRLWVVTYLGQGAGTTLTTISDPGIAGISYELQRLDFRSGTYGLWNAPTLALASTIGPISFDTLNVPANNPRIPTTIPDGAIMVATLCESPSTSVLDCGPSD
jgi:hypothetical protein